MGHDGDESGHCKRDWWQIVHSIKALSVGPVLVVGNVDRSLVAMCESVRIERG